MEQPHECRFCGSKFHRAETLHTHMCVKKRRHMEINTVESRLAFRAFQRFYDLATPSKKQKTAQDFIDSPFYIDFVKFGNHLAVLKPVYPEKFIEFVINHSIKLKDWSKDYVYYAYIEDLIKKEPAEAATERSIAEILAWTDNNKAEFSKFFSLISANEASHMICTGKISPWVLYLCTSGGTLMDKFNEDHAKMIGNIIDPSIWMKKFKNNPDDVTYIKSILVEVGV